jgi:hypothetical protein
MSDEALLNVVETVGSPLCVATEDGEAVHDRVAKALRSNRSIRLSFARVETLTSAFLNASIGQLYGEFSEDIIRQRLQIQDMEDEDLALVQRVVERAKVYFSDPERFAKAQRNVLGEDDE